jgi:hypothetical protein
MLGCMCLLFHSLHLFLREFAKLRKATSRSTTSVCLSVYLSVRPSVRPSVLTEQLGSQWMDFYEIWYLSVSRKSVEKIQIVLQPDENSGYCTWIQYRRTFMIISCSFLLRMRSFSDKFCREKLRDRPQMTMWRTRIAYWTTKATYTRARAHAHTHHQNKYTCWFSKATMFAGSAHFFLQLFIVLLLS